MKNKIIVFITACCILPTSLIIAQKDVFSFGPRVGVNFANVSNVDDSKTAIGLVLGLTSTYSISEMSGLSLDILYSQEGYKRDNDPDVGLDYLQIPVYFNLFLGKLGEAFRPKVYVGVAPGFLLKAEAGSADIKDDSNSVIFSVTGGLGFNYRLADRIWLNADVRSFIGLSDVRDKMFQTGDKIAARNVQLSAGVAFGLAKLTN